MVKVGIVLRLDLGMILQVMTDISEVDLSSPFPHPPSPPSSSGLTGRLTRARGRVH